ncbi:MAG TPA: CDP-diacylglycerol--glycerol-3-phosphate 3-phosphatidyltransferase [Persephonella sp.]|uniref:CDP-diacylglycerol--glycerol-3-phosphate 3-phosphatidyltransferase n=1 Tax=Persephonella marina (strain DSM 14350 / EX-H1) TaxID=123214 RepID=C0QSP4_PERMH|nr:MULTISPECIES: CDP-diacylglycerol--glycerol-3-phosphate 3-phosphatidyltransferase [Persephonella]ACO03165.1 CDP-diacylglycerol--glycerol-3-phosphate 3-phosphatidyltransferase [Persephonella marina EX-H1]HCB69437.1 CDP-diacylglycerol--glycerol-3-phosphate 3-phosphatidyltransferase [Persephonella sp.]
MGLANQITIFRILLVPVFIIFVGYNKPLYALITFFIAGLTDALDGFVARKFNQVTTLGKILDPIADKTLIVSSFIFIYNSDMSIKFPFWYVVLVISRDVYILAGSVIIYFLRGALEIKPSIFGKATTFFQILSVITVLLANITTVEMVYVKGIIYTATFFTVLSALTYFYEGLQKLK